MALNRQRTNQTFLSLHKKYTLTGLNIYGSPIIFGFPLFYLQNFAQILISTFLHESSSPKLLAICLLWLPPHSFCSLKGWFFFFWFVCLFTCFSVPLCRGRQLVKCWECNPDFLMLSWAFSLLHDPNFGQSSNAITYLCQFNFLNSISLH